MHARPRDPARRARAQPCHACGMDGDAGHGQIRVEMVAPGGRLPGGGDTDRKDGSAARISLRGDRLWAACNRDGQGAPCSELVRRWQRRSCNRPHAVAIRQGPLVECAVQTAMQHPARDKRSLRDVARAMCTPPRLSSYCFSPISSRHRGPAPLPSWSRPWWRLRTGSAGGRASGSVGGQQDRRLAGNK